MYQKNGKYLAELINPNTGDWDFTSFSVGIPISQETDTNQNMPVVQTQIPAWIKNNAKTWSQNLISDDEFVKGLVFLASQDMIKIPQSNSNHIPSWVKTNAGLWSAGEISDEEFVKGLQYLTDNGIILVRK
ncbi:MAG: peptidase, partial [Nitrosotalea sp.]